MTPEKFSGIIWGAIITTWMWIILSRRITKQARDHGFREGAAAERAARDTDVANLITQLAALPDPGSLEVEFCGGPCDGYVHLVATATEVLAMNHPMGRSYYILRSPVQPDRKPVPYDFIR